MKESCWLKGERRKQEEETAHKRLEECDGFILITAKGMDMEMIANTSCLPTLIDSLLRAARTVSDDLHNRYHVKVSPN